MGKAGKLADLPAAAATRDPASTVLPAGLVAALAHAVTGKVGKGRPRELAGESS